MGVVRRGKVRSGLAEMIRHDTVGQVVARRGQVWQVGFGLVWCGEVRYGKAGVIGCGQERQGPVWLGRDDKA